MYYSIIKPIYNKYHLLYLSFTNNSLPLTHIHTHTKSATKALLFSLPRCQPFSLYNTARCLAPCLHGSKAAPGTCRCLARPDRRCTRWLVALLHAHKYATAPIRENRSLNKYVLNNDQQQRITIPTKQYLIPKPFTTPSIFNTSFFISQ